MSIERTIAEAIAKNPDLAGVSFPDLYGSTALALRAFWDNLAPSLDHNTATLNDLGVCESCEEINVVSAYGELWLCPRCVADESKCAKSPGVEREATPGVEPEDATCVHCEPKAEELVTATVDPSLVVWRNHGFGRVVAASAEEAPDARVVEPPPPPPAPAETLVAFAPVPPLPPAEPEPPSVPAVPPPPVV
jgi:hypothetical protein